MAGTLVEVTDLVEFLQRQESASGVQRVVAETAPRVIARSAPAQAVVLDRASGRLVALTDDEARAVLQPGDGAEERTARAAVASGILDRARTAAAAGIDSRTTIVYLGAVWINDALMLAARAAHAAGARSVVLLYDLTPVLETGHTAAVNGLFERYLALVMQTASRAPAISGSTRRDFEAHARERGWPAPAGAVTGLPCGLDPRAFDPGESPWPRPYALFVGTVESRKNHLLALRAWQALVERHGADAVPDLVCVGRLGWNAAGFLREYAVTRGLGGKVSVLSTGVSDADLARLYAHCEFTVYPSRYEGWGLPVSESLAFGKVPVVARTSSLPEAGGDLAVYFASDDLEGFVATVERVGLDPAARAQAEQRIRAAGPAALDWDHVADVITAEIAAARAEEGRPPVPAELELGREYMLAVPEPAPDAGHADRYYAHVMESELTLLLRQPRDPREAELVAAAVTGQLGSPQAWGLEVRPGRRVEVRVRRPIDGPLALLIGTRSMPGVVIVEAAGPGGPQREEAYLGSVLTLALGDGKAGEPALVTFTVTDATDSVEGFLGIRSLVLLRADDLLAQVIAHRTAAQALRAELDFMASTRSWKVTAPLRRMKGRGSRS
ncbi:MAG: glycosyltransferase family 4 protein [Candidatus Nanopelagicales bacterium]